MKLPDAPLSGHPPDMKTLGIDGHNIDLNQVRSTVTETSSKALADLLQRFFVVVDDELFKRSDKLDGDAHQSVYFHEMRLFRKEAATLQSNLLAKINDGFDQFWGSVTRVAEKANALTLEAPPGERSEFSLLENEALEEEIAVTTMIQKGNRLFQDHLLSLAQRLGALVHQKELDIADLPLSPAAVCRAFASSIKPLGSELVVRLLVYKLFERVVVADLGNVFNQINAFLIQEGILPNLPKSIKRGTVPQPNQQSPSMAAINPVDGDGGQMAYLEVFQGMQRLLDGWRSQMGMMPLSTDGMTTHMPAFETGEVIKALSTLQMPESGATSGTAFTDGVKVYVASQLAQNHPGENRPLGRQEEDIIDMVALVFDFILDDRNLPDPVKGLIARLQIPVIKVAIIEKSFFGRKNHPVRLLLNSLAQAGIGLDTTDDIGETAVFRKIGSIVTRILDEFDQNVGLFSELLDEFMVFLERDSQRSRVAEERTRQVTQSREQLHLAKRKIAYEIATRLEGRSAPAAVRSFLYNTWKDVLVLSYLRREKQPRDWDNALIVMEKLIWTVTPTVDAQARRSMIQIIPRLLKAIRVGLESISMDPQSVAVAIKELEHCHVSRLSKGGHEVPEGGSQGVKVNTTDDELLQPVDIKDPELAQAIKDIKANLPEVQNLSANDLAGEKKSVDSTIAEGEFWEKARALELGRWLEFEEGNKQVRGKLSWKSSITSNYVFVNRKGAKIVEIGLDELVRRLGEGKARFIEDADVPLMDRAFGALLNKLNSPLGKSA